jgi:D-amino-acid oxidase
MGNRILIVGAGVSGLTTGYVLSERGHDVTVLAERDASDTPSVVAGALWEWPPAVCGHHNDVKSLDRSKPWCIRSYERFSQFSLDPSSGVLMRKSHFYFHKAIEDSEEERSKMLDLVPHVSGFVRDPDLVFRNGINPNLGLVDAYAHLAPIIDTDVYMQKLRHQLLQNGCQFVRRRLNSDLRETAADLLAEFDAAIIVNCAGLGARELASDPMFPLRGALVRLVNDGKHMPSIIDAHCIANDESNADQNMIYVVPRGRDRLLLGGIAEPNEWDTNIDLTNCAAVRDILERCRHFMPVLRRADLHVSPVIVGLRPGRQRNVRLDREPAHPVIHNYGHGGSGFSLSWGCAEEVADLVHALTPQLN